MNNPPAPKPHNPRFSGRDWRDVQVGELMNNDDVKWVTMETSVEDATMVRWIPLMLIYQGLTMFVGLAQEQHEQRGPHPRDWLGGNRHLYL